jgi:hypothetical protein
MTTIQFLEDLFSRRQQRKVGYQNIRNVELIGGTIIEPMAFEPDPVTHRREYYYNSVTNILYRKVVSREVDNRIVFAYWQKISE